MKALFKWSRWLHIYISGGLFSLLIFFCVTGVLLNHLDWVSGSKNDGSVNGYLPTKQWHTFRSSDKPLQLRVLSQYANRTFGLPAPSQVNWDDAFDEVVLDFPLPAGYAALTLNTQSGNYVLDYQTGTVWQVLNDLHKGRHTREAWRWVIDISALLIVVFALTGIILLFQNKKKRSLMISVVLTGLLTPVAIYLLCVPRLVGL